MWFHVDQESTTPSLSENNIPVPADYNGDGRVEAALFEPSSRHRPPEDLATWHIDGMPDVQWGVSGDIPVPADYNGDGTADIAVYRSWASTWYVRGVGTWGFGFPGDVPLPQDVNGDGVADLVLYRPSTATCRCPGTTTATATPKSPSTVQRTGGGGSSSSGVPPSSTRACSGARPPATWRCGEVPGRQGATTENTGAFEGASPAECHRHCEGEFPIPD